MQPTPHPVVYGRSNAALAEAYLAYSGKGGALEQCNADKAAMRQWVQAAKK